MRNKPRPDQRQRQRGSPMRANSYQQRMASYGPSAAIGTTTTPSDRV